MYNCAFVTVHFVLFFPPFVCFAELLYIFTIIWILLSVKHSHSSFLLFLLEEWYCVVVINTGKMVGRPGLIQCIPQCSDILIPSHRRRRGCCVIALFCIFFFVAAIKWWYPKIRMALLRYYWLWIVVCFLMKHFYQLDLPGLLDYKIRLVYKNTIDCFVTARLNQQHIKALYQLLPFLCKTDSPLPHLLMSLSIIDNLCGWTTMKKCSISCLQ